MNEMMTVQPVRRSQQIATMPCTGRDIAVVIPAYNAADYIADAINSVLAQTVQPREVIVVDDGSSDDTAKRVREHFESVRMIARANGGPAAARNTGIASTDCEWIALLDADDSWLPHRLECQLPYTESADVALVHSYVQASRKAYRSSGEQTFEELWRHNPIGTSTVLLRKVAFQDVGQFDEDRAVMGTEDYNLWLRIAATHWKIVSCPVEVSAYTPAEGNLSSHSEKILQAELANIEKIAQSVSLPRATVRQKRLDLCRDYGRWMLEQRDLGAARNYLQTDFFGRPSPSTFLYWAATFAPRSLLDWRRRLKSS